MNRKKGFTLVELLAVIAILAIILTILAPSLLNGVKSKKEDALNKIYDLIELAARNYVMDYDIDTPTIIQMEDLCKTNYIDCPILNPETEEELDGYVYAGKDFLYGEQESIKLTVDPNGGVINQTFSDSYAPGTVIELQDASKENTSFAGWKVVKGNSIIEGNTLTIGTTDTVIRAIWGDIILVDIPTQSGTLTYNESSQSPTWNNYDTSIMTISGDTSATNAGIYLATFTLPDGYGWEDGTINPKTVEWSIGKAEGTLSLSETSGTINGKGNTKTFTVNRSGDGEIVVDSSDESIATVSVSGTTVTVTAKDYGTATITVSVEAGTNHDAASSETYTITVDYLYLYKRGDKRTDVTGGWTQYRYGGAYWYNGTLNFNSDNIYFYASTAYMSAIGTTNKIDVTNFNHLGIVRDSGSNTIWLSLKNDRASDSDVADVWTKVSTEIDIASITGSYYVCMEVKVPDNSSSTSKATVYEVYLK